MYWTSGYEGQWSLRDGKQRRHEKQNDCSCLLPGKASRLQDKEAKHRVQVSPRKHNWEPGELEGPKVHKAEYQSSSKSLVWHIQFCMTWSNHLLPVLPPWESVLKFIFPVGQTMCRSLRIPLSLLSAGGNFSDSPILETKVFPCWIFTKWPNLIDWSTATSVEPFLKSYLHPIRTPNFLPLDSTRAVEGWIIPPPKMSMSKTPKPVKMSPHLVKGKMCLGF